MDHTPFAIRGFNMCESLLRHSPEQLRTFIRRMKKLRLNTLILHYDYGWKRYQDLLIAECEACGIEIILMTFGPRTFFSYCDWKPQWLAGKEDGTPWTCRLECEPYPCAAHAECLEAYEYGARQWLLFLSKPGIFFPAGNCGILWRRSLILKIPGKFVKGSFMNLWKKEDRSVDMPETHFLRNAPFPIRVDGSRGKGAVAKPQKR